VLGTSSLVPLIGTRLASSEQRAVEQTAWDRKASATVQDVLAAVRLQIWKQQSNPPAGSCRDVGLLSPSVLDRLLSAACLSLDMDKVELREQTLRARKQRGASLCSICAPGVLLRNSLYHNASISPGSSLRDGGSALLIFFRSGTLCADLQGLRSPISSADHRTLLWFQTSAPPTLPLLYKRAPDRGMGRRGVSLETSSFA